ncbi:hypothetical protein [Pararhodobacter zhoushanensis]|uniref:hypothetical protein n=1 Tax=Pararhodobacter zhoushanensis TaxID=2479545 RepID=UPI000F8DD468|nr:hypothetical protein [Pararhodobacter zhoushanensis]
MTSPKTAQDAYDEIRAILDRQLSRVVAEWLGSGALERFILRGDGTGHKDIALSRFSQGPKRAWGWRRLAKFKTINGRRFQLHATRGWKCIGRAQ